MSAPGGLSRDAAQAGTIAAALAFAETHLQAGLAAEFEDRGELRSEARALVRLAARCGDAYLYANSSGLLDADVWRRLREFVQRRAGGEPLAYIEQRRGFHAIDIRVDAHVLVPRPETELIVEAVLADAPQRPFAVLDLGTGSGAIALAIAHARRDASVTAVDISAAALDVARGNAAALGLEIEFLESDWFSALAPGRYDFICCNPPYVAAEDPHLARLSHEPRIALEAGSDGLREIRRVLANAAAWLGTGATLLLEHGFDQAGAVARIGADAGLRRRRILRDLAGHERTTEFELSG